MIKSQDDLGQRSETIRRANLSTIVRELHEDGPLSRSELVTRTGLTRSAIRDLIGELVSSRLVTEEGTARVKSPGRPSPLVRPNHETAWVLAFEIAVDSLAVATVGLGGKVTDIRRIGRVRSHCSVEEIVLALQELRAEVLPQQGLDENCVGIGVAVVGVVRRLDGFVSMAPNLGWHDVPLGERLKDAFGSHTPIWVANEADLGVLAELRRGAARGVDNAIFLSGEVGVGGGLIVDGKPLTGIAGYGGEIGHMPVNPNGRPCRCGSIGCWETEIGEEALLARAGLAPGGGPAAVDLVLRRADEGSAVEIQALEEVGRWLGFGLGGLVNLLDPRLIVLGGQFVRLHKYVCSALERELDRKALSAPRALVTVEPSMLGDDAPLLGAAELAFEPLLADPAGWMSRRRQARSHDSSNLPINGVHKSDALAFVSARDSDSATSSSQGVVA